VTPQTTKFKPEKEQNSCSLQPVWPAADLLVEIPLPRPGWGQARRVWWNQPTQTPRGSVSQSKGEGRASSDADVGHFVAVSVPFASPECDGQRGKAGGKPRETRVRSGAKTHALTLHPQRKPRFFSTKTAWLSRSAHELPHCPELLHPTEETGLVTGSAEPQPPSRSGFAHSCDVQSQKQHCRIEPAVCWGW